MLVSQHPTIPLTLPSKEADIYTQLSALSLLSETNDIDSPLSSSNSGSDSEDNVLSSSISLLLPLTLASGLKTIVNRLNPTEEAGKPITLGLVIGYNSKDVVDEGIVKNAMAKMGLSMDVLFHLEDFTGHNKGAVSSASALEAFALAGLRCIIALPTNKESLGSETFLYILEKPQNALVFPPPGTDSLRFGAVATKNIPSLAEWSTLWSTWDLVTLGMIPKEMVLQKPIDLRHKCLFYIGHIPTFLDMLLAKTLGLTERHPFWDIFERGIDPHVDDPEHCHSHSEVPDRDEDWPSLQSIIAFRDGVRERLREVYTDLESGKNKLTRGLARTLVMTLEHEGFHIETLLYMLIQRAGTGTLPPPGFTVPPWSLLTAQWDSIPEPVEKTVVVGPAAVVLGHDDSEADDSVVGDLSDLQHEFGWDNESPQRVEEVGRFRADWRPICNGEFERFWSEGEANVEMPKSWVLEDGEVKVRTMYGPVSMDIAKHWPVLTSYDDLAAFARSKGGRLPTEPELRLFLDTHEVGYEGGGNIGFRNWHPVPPTMGLGENGGKGSNGGVWEWTSTVFDGHEGLVPTNLFTGYSTDFFDGKHQVVLGASYATIPRLASRRTVRNFYQHNYPYPWVGARVVYDF